MLIWTTCSAVVINLLFLAFAFMLDVLYSSLGWPSEWPVIPCRGLIPVAIYAITLQSLAAGDAPTSFFGIPLKSRHYPLVLVGLFVLLGGPTALQDVTGLALGYLHGWLKLDTFLPSDGKLQRWERPPALLFGRRLFGGRWVRVDEATGHDSQLPTYRPINQPGRRDPRTGPGAQFPVFQGAGHRLGS